MKFRGIFFAGFATAASLAHGQGYWEARMLLATRTNGVSVVRIGEAEGVMSRTGEVKPEVVVVANSNGWVSVTPAGEFPRDAAAGDPGRKGMLVLRFWGRPETMGKVEAHVVGVNGKISHAPEFEWMQTRGWQAPSNATDARWDGDLDLLARETSAEWQIFAVVYKRSGTLLMAK